MAFNISTFKQQMTGDGARPNLFRVTLGGASGYLDIDSDDHFFIRASSIPGGTIGQVVVPYFGREVKFAGNRTFAEWTVTVINDENFKTRGRLERWMERINNHQANLRSGNTPGGYFGTGTVTQLGKNTSTQTLRTYSFVNIFLPICLRLLLIGEITTRLRNLLVPLHMITGLLQVQDRLQLVRLRLS